MAETSISSKFLLLLFICTAFLGAVSGDYYYNDQSSSLGEWGTISEFDSQDELVRELVAPFLFIVVLLQFSLRKTLAFTFANDDDYERPFSRNEEPNVSKEATVMAVAIALMMVASPYWSLVQTVATGIGLTAMLGLVLVFLFLIYMFVRP